MAKKSGKTVSKKSVAKTGTKRATTAAAASAKPRRVKLGNYRSLRLQKRIKHPVRLPSVWRLTKQAALTLWQHKRLFISITLIYGLLNLVLAQGVSGGTDVSQLKHALNQVFTGNFGFLGSS